MLNWRRNGPVFSPESPDGKARLVRGGSFKVFVSSTPENLNICNQMIQ